jgi:tetratricopeptide (TPR) repeat protein
MPVCYFSRVLARHYTEAGLIEKAVSFWRTAGQRSLARSALLEGAQQIKRALDQIAILPATPDLHGARIKLHVAFANALTLTGNFVDGKEHYDRALAIYDAAEHRPLTTRSGRDIRVALLASRSGCAWLLGYPAAARSDADQALKEAREIKHATTLLHALWRAGYHHILCGDYAAAIAPVDELLGLADERRAPYWKALGTAERGWLFASTGKASDAVRAITLGITSLRSMERAAL